jgi:hypothetical protein
MRLLVAANFAAQLSQARGHPSLRSEDPFLQRRNVQIGVQRREVKAKPGRVNLNFLQLLPGSRFQPLHIARREGNLQPIAQAHYNASDAAILTGADGVGNGSQHLLLSPAGFQEFFMPVHVFPPMPAK